MSYSPYELTGKDFAMVSSDRTRRIVFSPNGTNSVSVKELPDGCLCMANNGKADFNFSVSRNRKVLAVVTCNGTESNLKINTNWKLSVSGIANKEIHTNPDLTMSQTINIEIGVGGFGRLDLKVDQSGYAALVFSNKDLLFVKMNGNHTVPRLEGYIEFEKKKMIEEFQNDPEGINDEAFQKIGQTWFQRLVSRTSWLLNRN